MLGMLIIFFIIYKSSRTENNTAIFNTPLQIDTVEVITEYDGDREIRWYALDTIEYESIDTIIMNYDWGREEIYFFKYKNDTTEN